MIPDAERSLLAERARALARPVQARADDGGHSVVFTLSRERYAIDANFVQAAFRLRQLTRIPGARPPVVALTRWRGDAVTLLDIRALVGAAPGALDDLAVVLIIGRERAEFGVLADTLEGFAPVTGDVLPVSRARLPDSEPILRGVTRDALHIIDPAALIARQFPAVEHT